MEKLHLKNGGSLRCVIVMLLAAGLLNIAVLGPLYGQDAEELTAEQGGKKAIAALIPCKGMIDDGLFQSIKRRSQEAMDLGATYLIYEIGTYGGLVISGDKISDYFILDAGKKVHTVAYVTTKAISAGAMISVSCKDIIMLEHTTIGDCAPITMGGELKGVEREKAESFIRSTFSRAAQANGYPEALLKAMVSQHIEVYRLKNTETGEYEFFETKDIPTDPNAYDLDNQKLIVSSDEILTLTAEEATEYGIARTEVEDLDEVLAFLAERDGVKFSGKTLEFGLLWSEQMVRWINSPAVMGILVMIAMLGVYIELNTPGLGLPGLLAVVCIVIIVGSKFLVGMANWVEIAIFALGMILLMIEVFVIPGFGIAGLMGIVCILAGLFGMLVKNAPDQIPWPKSEFDWDLFTDGILGLITGLIGAGVFGWILTRYLPKMEFMSGLILKPTSGAGKVRHRVAARAVPPEGTGSVEVGLKGVVVTALRPIGSARFGETIVDVVAHAEFIETGDAVEIVEIHGNRVVVREMDA